MKINDHITQIRESANKFSITLSKGLETDKLQKIQRELKIKLPKDLIDFYMLTNGLQGDDFIFNIIPLNEIRKDVDSNGIFLEFAEYMIYSEICGLEISTTDVNNYRIFSQVLDLKTLKPIGRKYLTNSLVDFIKLYTRYGISGIWG